MAAVQPHCRASQQPRTRQIPPETPANLTAVAGADGSKTVMADWDDSRRTDSYRFHAVTKAAGEELAIVIAQDSQISVVLSGTGRNSAGESPASDPVEIAVPMPEKLAGRWSVCWLSTARLDKTPARLASEHQFHSDNGAQLETVLEVAPTCGRLYRGFVIREAWTAQRSAA